MWPTDILLSRRRVLAGAGAMSIFATLGSLPLQAAGSLRLLDPAKVRSWHERMLHSGHHKDGIAYADEGPRNGQPILYFHGITSPYEVSLPLEYPIIEAGYRLIMPNRPGYRGTSRNYGTDADSIAKMGKSLLEILSINGPVIVSGTSAGGAAALVFASLYPTLTKALILSSPFTHTWTEKRYVPEYLHDDFEEAEKSIIPLDAKKTFAAAAQVATFLHKYLGTDIDQPPFDESVIGRDNLSNAQRDIAYEDVKKLLSNKSVIENNLPAATDDIRSIFCADDEFVSHWTSIHSPVLLTHCQRDPLVPIAHSEFVVSKLPSAILKKYKVAGHVTCLGDEAHKLHDDVIAFLQSCAAARSRGSDGL